MKNMLPWKQRIDNFLLKSYELWHRKLMLGMSKTNEILQVARVITDK